MKSIACKRNITLVNILSTRMLMAHGFLRRIFEVFDRYRDVRRHDRHLRGQRLADRRQPDARWKQIAPSCENSPKLRSKTIKPSSAWWAKTSATLPAWRARVFKALDGVNVRMVSQGASQLNHGLRGGRRGSARGGSGAAPGVFRRLDPAVFEYETLRCLNLAIVGYGKMGRLIDQLAPEYGFTVTARWTIRHAISSRWPGRMSR